MSSFAPTRRWVSSAVPLAVSGYDIGVIGLTLAGLAARMVMSARVSPLLVDEAFTGVLIRRSFASMLDVIRHDNHPPLFYLLERAASVASTSPLQLRLLPALAGAAAIPVGAALGRRLNGNRGGLFAAVLIAYYPAYLIASREARMYSLATFLVLAVALALWRAVEKPTPLRLLAYAALVSAAVYTHYFALLAVAAQLMVALLLLKPGPRTAARLLAAATGGAVTLAPWLLYALPQLGHVAGPFWVTWETIFPSIPAMLHGATPKQVSSLLAWLSLALALAALVLHLRHASTGERRRTLFLAGCAFVPTTALLAASLWKPLYDPGFAAIFWGPGMAATGAALAALRRGWIGAAIGPPAILITVLLLFQVPSPDFATVLAPVQGRLAPQDVIVLGEPDEYFPIAYSVDPETLRAVRVVAVDVPWFYGTAAYPPGTQVRAVPDTGGRVYAIVRTGSPGPPMAAGLRLVESHCSDGVCLRAYSRSGDGPLSLRR